MDQTQHVLLDISENCLRVFVPMVGSRNRIWVHSISVGTLAFSKGLMIDREAAREDLGCLLDLVRDEFNFETLSCTLMLRGGYQSSSLKWISAENLGLSAGIRIRSDELESVLSGEFAAPSESLSLASLTPLKLLTSEYQLRDYLTAPFRINVLGTFCRSSYLQSLVSTLNDSAVHVRDVLPISLSAASLITRSTNQKNFFVLEFGDQFSDVAVIDDAYPVRVFTIPIGMNHFATDLRICTGLDHITIDTILNESAEFAQRFDRARRHSSSIDLIPEVVSVIQARFDEFLNALLAGLQDSVRFIDRPVYASGSLSSSGLLFELLRERLHESNLIHIDQVSATSKFSELGLAFDPNQSKCSRPPLAVLGHFCSNFPHIEPSGQVAEPATVDNGFKSVVGRAARFLKEIY